MVETIQKRIDHNGIVFMSGCEVRTTGIKHHVKNSFFIHFKYNINMSDNRYLHRFFKLNTAPLLLEKKVFPNIKEITESFGAFTAIYDNFNLDRKSNNIDVFVVGDGHSPRTGALIACLTNWNIKSIDPVMKIKNWGFKRLEVFRNKIEEIEFTGDKTKIAVIVCVHSHAPISSTLKQIKGYSKKYLVNIPCCFKSDIEQKPHKTYSDNGIQSEKNTVELYSNCS